jgi:hypothetical protein
MFSGNFPTSGSTTGLEFETTVRVRPDSKYIPLNILLCPGNPHHPLCVHLFELVCLYDLRLFRMRETHLTHTIFSKPAQA